MRWLKSNLTLITALSWAMFVGGCMLLRTEPVHAPGVKTPIPVATATDVPIGGIQTEIVCEQGKILPHISYNMPDQHPAAWLILVQDVGSKTYVLEHALENQGSGLHEFTPGMDITTEEVISLETGKIYTAMLVTDTGESIDYPDNVGQLLMLSEAFEASCEDKE